MAGYIGSKRSSSLVSTKGITLEEVKLAASGDSITKSDGTTAVLSESSGTVTFTTNNAVIEGSSSGNLVRITQTGSGNALVVEDSANPDSSPFVVTSSGDVIVGKTSTAIEDVGLSILSTGRLIGTADSDDVLVLRRNTTDGDIISFRKDNAIVGGIGVATEAGGSGIFIGKSDTCLAFQTRTDNAITPFSADTGAVRDNAIDLGVLNVARFNDAYVTNGVTSGSDANEKTEITTSELGLDFINKINPVSYKFIGRYRTHYGMISQEIETLLSDLGKTSMDFAGFIKSPVTDEDGNETGEFKYGLRYAEFISPMIKAIQEQQILIESQQSQIDALTARIEALENQPT